MTTPRATTANISVYCLLMSISFAQISTTLYIVDLVTSCQDIKKHAHLKTIVYSTDNIIKNI